MGHRRKLALNLTQPATSSEFFKEFRPASLINPPYIQIKLLNKRLSC